MARSMITRVFLCLVFSVPLVGCGQGEDIGPSKYGVGAIERAMAEYVTEYPGRTEEDLEKNAAIVEDVERLIERGADVNYQRPDRGDTPLHAAILLNSPELVEVLIEHGARLDIKEHARGGHTPLAYAKLLQEKRPERDYSEVIRILESAQR